MAGSFIIKIDYDPSKTDPWTITPDSQRVPPGNQPVIWQLTEATVNRGVKFPATGGIVFPPANTAPKNNLHDWPGTVPERQNDQMYTSTDRNTLQSGDLPQVFRYDISVVFNGNTITRDPDVTNTPPGGGGMGGDDDDDQGGGGQGGRGGQGGPHGNARRDSDDEGGD